MLPLVSVITVNYNHSHVTEELLASIERTNTYERIEIIIVDNGSQQNPVPAWQAQYPHIKCIRSEQNLGFAGGNNLGIQQAQGDLLFFVNNDTEFTPNLIQLLVDMMLSDDKIGMVSPKIRYFSAPSVLQYAGFTSMNYYTVRNQCIGQFEQDNGQYDHLTGPTGFIHGAAMLVRRAAIMPDNLMPEQYFLYYEEMDWCEQIKRKGYTIMVQMQALIYHKESISVGDKSPLKEYFMLRNRLLFIRRNGQLKHQLFFFIYFCLVVAPRNIINYIKNKEYKFISILFRALFWNFTHSKNSNDLGYKLK
jgi:GT2 family glycosyltransferase